MFMAFVALLALIGGYVAVTWLIHLSRLAAYWLAFQFAGEEHPPNADRLADAMEPR
jgi:hypothetical protein